MLAAIFFLAMFVALSLSDEVDGVVNIAKEQGWALLSNELFNLAAAGLGASFFLLWQVHKNIANYSFDPKETALYWTKLLLGVMSGFLLVGLIPDPSNIDEHTEVKLMTHAALAMLGGFSASVLYNFLTHLVEVFEGAFGVKTGENGVHNQRVVRPTTMDKNPHNRPVPPDDLDHPALKPSGKGQTA
jgi:hypothetical protein